MPSADIIAKRMPETFFALSVADYCVILSCCDFFFLPLPQIECNGQQVGRHRRRRQHHPVRNKIKIHLISNI